MWVSHRHVASTATAPPNPTRVRWRRTSARAHLVVIPAGGRHWSSSSSAGGHSVKSTVSTAGPAPPHGEPSHESAATPPLFKHHSETTVFIRLVVEVRVIWLRTALYGSLKKRDREDVLFCSRAFEMHNFKNTLKINVYLLEIIQYS